MKCGICGTTNIVEEEYCEEEENYDVIDRCVICNSELFYAPDRMLNCKLCHNLIPGLTCFWCRGKESLANYVKDLYPWQSDIDIRRKRQEWARIMRYLPKIFDLVVLTEEVKPEVARFLVDLDNKEGAN